MITEPLEAVPCSARHARRQRCRGLSAAYAARCRSGQCDSCHYGFAIRRWGRGIFLVSLVDKLADHVLDAMAEAVALGVELHYTSPLADKIEDIRATILKNARAANWTIDEEQLDDRHIVRRMVLKRCVYGVDKNPMAVELAKVALWLHTFTVGAPLSFIDHHLHVGDSLFGLWVRDAIDKATRWVASFSITKRSATLSGRLKR